MIYQATPGIAANGPCWRILRDGKPMAYPVFYPPDAEQKARQLADELNQATKTTRSD